MTFVRLGVYGNAESAFVSSPSMPKKKWVCQKLSIRIHEPVITHAGNVVYKPQWPEPGPASKRIQTELDGMYDQLQKPNPHPLNGPVHPMAMKKPEQTGGLVCLTIYCVILTVVTSRQLMSI